MTVGQADLAQAINAVWDASTLDALFKALWGASVDADEYPVLNDQEAGGEQPFPFCVFEISSGSTASRQSKGTNDIWEERDVPVNFRVHATDVSGDARTPKAICSYLIEEIMKVFGGHPTQAPTGLTLDNGNHLGTTYQNDYSVREGDDHYQWILSYSMKLDVPVTETAV